jgi:predicted amidohydrolase YtcJ
MANLIVRNARVWTVDPEHPTAEAIAIEGERITAVGSNADIDRARTPATRVVDAGGGFVLPGFNDAHLHLMMGATQLTSIDVASVSSPEEFARRVDDWAGSASGKWVRGGGWDEQAWTPPVLPSRHLIDALTPDTPVFLYRHDEHMAVANSVALTLAGITRETPDPPGGVIVRDLTGEPTGLLKDAAMRRVEGVMPASTLDERRQALVLAQRQFATLGVTSVTDMGTAADDLDLYRALARRDGLTVRIHAAPLAIEWIERRETGAGQSPRSAFVTTGAVKAFADGSLGSATAYLFEPYTDAPGSYGLLSQQMQPLERMRDTLTEADRDGQQLCVHAIGDRAVAMVLDLFAGIQAANGRRDRRWRIEHAQHVVPGDFGRFASLGVVASVQPYHAIDDGRWAERRIGAERAKTSFAYRSFLDHGVRLAIGTDWPVAPVDPMLTLYAAATRATLDGKNPGGWVSEQRVSAAEAIDAYTRGAAFAEFMEGEKGTLMPGKLADVVVLSGDLVNAPPEAIKEAKVRLTVVGGTVVYESS